MNFRKYIENEKQRKVVQAKLAANTPLSVEETEFMCNGLTLESCANRPECEAYYYRRLFIIFNSERHPLMQFAPLNYPNYLRLVHEWAVTINSVQIPGSILHAASKETKKEIKALKKENLTDEEYADRHFNLIAWSKFRHCLVKRNFDLNIKGNHFLLKLNGIDIKFDFESNEHILARHFGHGMKQYTTIKDHFYDVFGHEELQFELQNLFEEIDNSGFFINEDISEVNFRYIGIVYRIHIKKEVRYLPGITGPQDVYRLSTFFPLSEASQIALNAGFEEKYIYEDLSVFTKKII